MVARHSETPAMDAEPECLAPRAYLKTRGASAREGTKKRLSDVHREM